MRREDPEQRIEKVARLWLPLRCRCRLGLTTAIGIIAGNQLLPRRCIPTKISNSIILREACLQLLNLCIKSVALRRGRVEHQKLAAIAAERAGRLDGPVEFRALLLHGAAIMI